MIILATLNKKQFTSPDLKVGETSSPQLVPWDASPLFWRRTCHPLQHFVSFRWNKVCLSVCWYENHTAYKTSERNLINVTSCSDSPPTTTRPTDFTWRRKKQAADWHTEAVWVKKKEETQRGDVNIHRTSNIISRRQDWWSAGPRCTARWRSHHPSAERTRSETPLL